MNVLAAAILLVLLAVLLRVIADNGWSGLGTWLQAKFGSAVPATTSPAADTAATGAQAATAANQAAGQGGSVIGSAVQQGVAGAIANARTAQGQ